MQSVWGSLTITGTALRIVSTKTKACKLTIQSAPGNSGNIKIGNSSTMTADNTTPGTFLAATSATNPDSSPQPGQFWSLESHCDSNTLDISQYYINGTTSGDVVMWSYHFE